MIRVTRRLSIPESEITERFHRASGPGGQRTNKVATAVELRFDAARCRYLSEEMRTRLRRLAGRRMSKDGVLVIEAERFRSQEQNRRDARGRLVALLRRAAEPPRVRRPTVPGPAAAERRLQAKRRRALLKRARRLGTAEQ